MSGRYALSLAAADDLFDIWLYLRNEAGRDVADRVEQEIRDKIAALARMPGLGHRRIDLTDEPVRFFAVYSWLIVYLPAPRPLTVVAIVHGRRDLRKLPGVRLSS